MLKRTNKLTALLVAATAVASLAPAGVSAAEYKRISAEEGTIYNAVAFKDGSYVIDGNLVDEDTDAVYYVKDGKFTELEDVDTSSEMELFGDKYLSVEDGDYFIDLTTGKVVDEDLAEDAEDDAASALRKKIKDDTDDRYDETESGKIQALTLRSSQYGENWYQASIKKATGTGSYDLYTDVKGNYIDADYNLGKIRVEPTTGSAIEVKNTDDDYNFGKTNGTENKDNLKASVSHTEYLTQDSKYIYRKATITLKITDATATSTKQGTAVIDKVYGVSVKESNAFRASTDGKTVEFDVIQKISKAQASDDIDGAKYAKETTNYVISDEDGKVADADEANVVNHNDVEFTVVNGNLVAYTIENNKVQTVTVKLSKKKNLNYTDLADKAEEKVEKSEDGIYAVTTDANGNLWRLESGYVYKWDNDEDWDKVYKVDGSMDRLSVYDSNNMVVWNEDDEVYSLIGSKATTEDEEVAEDDKVEVVAGWVQAADGTWSYNNADGTKATGWLNLNGTWYYLNAQGTMQTGWANVNGTWYFLQSSGAMKTGWLLDGSTWYYMQASGAMATGWLNDNGTWYYLNANGSMAANTTVDGYVLGANGAWVR